jgi:hypothetical protein
VEKQLEKYLVLRKVRTCPAMLAKQGLPPQRDAVLVIIGQHFCLALDRSYALLEEYMRRVEALKQTLGAAYRAPKAVGGGPAYVDMLLGPDEHAGSAAAVDPALRRAAAEEYLSLEGSYGVLPAVGAAAERGLFEVQRSTQPWLESTALPWHTVRLEWGAQGQLKALHSLDPAGAGADSGSGGGCEGRLLGEWEALECSFDKDELQRIFSTSSSPPKLRARL